MVRPVESIRKDLNALEGATATLATEFSQIYATYLTVLGQAMGRQMVMATYHLCTQVYPDKFLALAVSDRGRLQQSMQDLGRQAQSWLQQLMEPKPPSAVVDPTQQLNPDDLNRLEAALAGLVQSSENAGAEATADGDEAETAPPADSENNAEGPDALGSEFIAIEFIGPDALAITPETSPEAAELSLPPLQEPSLSGDEVDEADAADAAKDSDSALDPKQLVQSVIMAAMASQVEEAFSDRPFTGDPLTPTLVAKHHLILEQMIRDVLERASRKANQLLRKAEVIPDLPEAVLEVASDTDMAMPKGRAVPNVLNVLVAMAGDTDAAEFDAQAQDSDGAEVDSADDEDDAIEGTMTHLAAIHLRLADIEFGDVQSALWRSKLRTAVGRLRKLGKQYQRAERELAIAQAEQAWRAVWYDDSSR